MHLPNKITWTGEAGPLLSASLLQIQKVKAPVQISLQGHVKIVLGENGPKEEGVQVCMSPGQPFVLSEHVRTWSL